MSRAYLDMRALQRQLAVLNQNIVVARPVSISRRRGLDRGLSNEMDVTLAKRRAGHATSRFAAARRPNRSQRRHAIAVLLGQFPRRPRVGSAEQAVCPHSPVVSPSEFPSISSRSPDIAEAERRVAAATAQIGVATAQLFPAVVLTSAGGRAGGVPFHQPARRSPGSVRLDHRFIGLCLISGRSTHKSKSPICGRMSLAAYERTILTAVQRDFDDAAASFSAISRLRSLSTALAAAHQATQLATERYDRSIRTF